MTTLTLLGVATILSTTIATPVLAPAVIQESGAYAVYRPNGDSGTRSTPPQRRVVVGRGTADVVALARPSIRRQPEEKLQPNPGQRRSVTASRGPSMFPLRRPHLSRSLIKKTRTSTARSEAFAEAARRRKSWLQA
jgi:hypothetical protein